MGGLGINDLQIMYQFIFKQLHNINPMLRIMFISCAVLFFAACNTTPKGEIVEAENGVAKVVSFGEKIDQKNVIAYDDMLAKMANTCLLYTSPSPRDGLLSRMPSSA